MFVKSLSIQNYRTLENIQLSFSEYYTAISGKNNAGKSNIIRAIRCMLGDNFRIRLFGEGILGGGIEWKDDITSWVKDKDAELKITITFIHTKHKFSTNK